MKAYNLYNIGDLRYEETDYPECPKGWSIVKVKYAGICSSDIARIFAKGTYHFPTIPGHEFSGIVDQVADEEYRFLVGKKVGIFPLIPCRECEQCRNRHYEMCSHYDYIGSRRDGGFAEYVAVPVWNLVELPENVPLKEAAMMEPLAVALHAMKMADIKKGDKVGIIGTGMIAFAAAQWARKLGATTVTVIGRSEDKKALADTIPGICYAVSDGFFDEFDVVLEAVGSNSAIDKAVNVTKAGGHLILMGNPEGDILLQQNTYWRILRKQIVVTGTWNSSYENNKSCDWSEVCDALAEGTINAISLISHEFTQEALSDGLELMRIHREPYCKIMLSWNGGER